MSDEFDDLATGSYAPPAEAVTIPPEGKHLAIVADAMRRRNKFKADKWPENPAGWELSLTLQASVGDGRVTWKANIPAHRSAVIAHVFASAGLDAPVRGTPVNEGELVGRTVEVEVEHFTPDGGDKVFPIVKKWLPAGSVDVDPPGLPASKPAPAAKAKAAKAPPVIPNDDIPF